VFTGLVTVRRTNERTDGRTEGQVEVGPPTSTFLAPL